MNKQGEIYENLRRRIPTDLWDKYSHLSFKDMAQVEELQQWSCELQQANDQWFDKEESIPQ